MTRITVVIEDHAEGIHLGQQLAGGRVVSVQHGDHSGLLDASKEALEWFESRTAGFAIDAKDTLRMAIAEVRSQ